MSAALPVDGSTAAASVAEHDYQRLLGMRRDRAVVEDVVPLLRARAAEARGWYAAHARPFVAQRRVDIRSIAGGTVTIGTGDVLESAWLAAQLQAAAAGELVVLAASAGAEVVAEIERRWRDGRPDEAYWLDRFAAAVAERLLLDAEALRGEPRSVALEQWLPHLSPGCADWGLAGQHSLMSLLLHGRGEAAIGPVRLLESGALWPPHSVLAVRGISPGRPLQRPPPACRACDFDPCHYRRCPPAGERPPRRVPT